MIRLFNLILAPPDLPPHRREQIDAFNSSTRQVSAAAEELGATPETSAQVRSAGTLNDKPLAVVSASEQSPRWLEMQDELTLLSSDNIHRVVEGADHGSLLYDKHDAQVTSATIVEVVGAVRNDQPLKR